MGLCEADEKASVRKMKYYNQDELPLVGWCEEEEDRLSIAMISNVFNGSRTDYLQQCPV